MSKFNLLQAKIVIEGNANWTDVYSKKIFDLAKDKIELYELLLKNSLNEFDVKVKTTIE